MKIVREDIVAFLKNLRSQIIQEFETLEPQTRFQRKPWNHHSGGGGEISLLEGGQSFEKAAVNWSGVEGAKFPTDEAMGPFFATGVSLITHMRNPHAPTVHMNIRYIETKDRFWFGGGYDLTPMGFFYQEDVDHFHQTAQHCLKPFNVYDTFSANAKKYFYIPHRHKERGAGGIFFDHWNTGNPEQDLKMWKQVGSTFVNAIMPIYHKRINQPYTTEERQQQLRFRGHYVEFNLMYDRGTKFGFQSGGNPDAILCSMPPLASW